MNNILFFPTINKIIIDKLDMETKDHFMFYFNDEDDEILRLINIEYDNKSKIMMMDKNNLWSVDHHNLVIKKRIRFDSKPLFGESGIAPMNSILGIGIKYSSAKSNHRGIKEVFEFDSSVGHIDIETKYEFPKNSINDFINYSIIVYLKDLKGSVYDNESHLNIVKGTVLGELDKIDMSFRGEGSLFKTIKIIDKTKPLWYLRMDFEPTSYVNDSIELVINEGHKDYGIFDPQNKGKYNPDYILDMSISIVTMIIVRSFEYIDEIKNSNYEVGMIGHLIQYYINSYGISKFNIEEIHMIVSNEVRK